MGSRLVVAVFVALCAGCGTHPPQPQVSPPGGSQQAVSLPGWFAFTVAGGDIWAVRGDGSDRHQVTVSGGGVDTSPTWSPDASRLGYRHSVGPGGTPDNVDTIRTVRADGSGSRDLVPGSFPAWSPDGGLIAFRGNAEVGLAVIRPDGSGLTSLGVPNAECPVWSPDGILILYCRNEDASGRVTDDWNVWVMHRDGSDQRQLTDDPARDYPTAWSSDGSRVVFSSDRAGRFASFVMDANGSNVTRVSDATDLSAVGVWLPDGRFVIGSAGGDIPDWYVVADDASRQRLPQLAGAFDSIGWTMGR
jgi:Tol biopolymer transport system component